MKRILLSVAILLFLAGGTGGWLLYSQHAKTAEQIEVKVIEPSGAEAVKPTGTKPVEITPSPSPEQPNNTISNNTAKKNEDFSPEAVESAKDSIKKLVLSKLTPEDISELEGMLSNGITAEERRRVMEIVYSRLSAEDINKIKDAYLKYTQHN